MNAKEENRIRRLRNIASDVQIVEAERINDKYYSNALRITCPFCGEKHHHGGGKKKGQGDGYRCSHCPGIENTYYIIETY